MTRGGAGEYAAGATSRLLPPRPRPGDGLRAGLLAGTLLGVAEVGLRHAAGAAPAPHVAALTIAGAAALTAAAGGLGGILAAAVRARPSHSALVGAQLGSLLAAAALGRAGALALGGPGDPRVLAAAAATAAAALAVGAVAARTGDRLERSGLPLSAGLVLGPAAALVALGEAQAQGAADLASPIALGVALVALAGLGAGVLAPALRRAHRPAGWGASLLASLLLAAAVAAAPVLRPWLAGDPDGRELAPLPASGPVSLLVLDFGPVADDPGGPDTGEGPWTGASLGLLAADALRYPRLVDAAPPEVAGALLADPLGGPDLAARLDARGWATAAALRRPDRAAGLAVRERDARPGPGAWLEAFAPSLAAGPLLAALPAPLRAGLGLDAALRSPEALGADARRWLVAWRASRAQAPFLLLADYGGGEALARERIDAEAERWLRSLDQLGAGDRTMILAGVWLGEGDELRLDLLLRAPGATPEAPRGETAVGAILARDLAAFLSALPAADAAAPILLPGAPLRLGRAP